MLCLKETNQHLKFWRFRRKIRPDFLLISLNKWADLGLQGPWSCLAAILVVGVENAPGSEVYSFQFPEQRSLMDVPAWPPGGSGILVAVGLVGWCPIGLRLSDLQGSSLGALLWSIRRCILPPCLFEELPLGPMALPQGLRAPGLLMSILAKGRDLEKESFWEVTPLFPGAWLCSEHSWPPP